MAFTSLPFKIGEQVRIKHPTAKLPTGTVSGYNQFGDVLVNYGDGSVDSWHAHFLELDGANTSTHTSPQTVSIGGFSWPVPKPPTVPQGNGVLCSRHGWSDNANTCPACDTIRAVKPKEKDDAEERLRAKVIPKFNHEDRCQPPPMPDGMPVLPYFENAPERNEQSFRPLKRWVSTNLRCWPVCRFERTPLEMRIEGRAMKDDPYGGEKAVVVFYCANCGAWGR